VPGRCGSCGRAHKGKEEKRLGLEGAVESLGSLMEAGNNLLFLLNQTQEFT
jgi:hypothetical protein